MLQKFIASLPLGGPEVEDIAENPEGCENTEQLEKLSRALAESFQLGLRTLAKPPEDVLRMR